MGTQDLHFNLSHSEGLALIAVTRNSQLGVDLERVRSNVEIDAIARRFFSTSEKEALASLPASLRRRAFFVCWTRKEAYVKGRGEGMNYPSDCFAVTVDPRFPADLIQNTRDPSDLVDWTLGDLRPGRGFVGALAALGHGHPIRCMEWIP